MEYQGVFYRGSSNVYEFMLKGESMICNTCGNSWICKCRPSQGRYQPAKIKPFRMTTPNTAKYLKLHNGDIYDVKTNTIVNRKALLGLLRA